MLGMNVDYRHWPSVQEQTRLAADLYLNLKCKVVRTVLKPDELAQWNSWYDICHQYGLDIIAVQAKESGDIKQYTYHYFDYLQIGNEPFNTGQSSWTQTYEELNSYLRTGRLTFPGMYIICAGLADGDPNHLNHINLDLVNAIAAHPGEETEETIDDYVAKYAAFGKPLFITEFYHTEFVKKLNNHPSVQAACFFCYDDKMVDGHGLYDHGVEKPEYKRFVEQLGEDHMISVGQGILDEMANRNDRPIRDSEWHTNDDGSIYEKGFGEIGIYEASNASGDWHVYFRPHYPLS